MNFSSVVSEEKSFCKSGCAYNGITDAVDRPVDEGATRYLYLRTAITIHVYH